MGTDPRTPERLRHHFEVERELAARLRQSTREDRSTLFGSLYQELFDRVPDHPRLVRRETPEESHRSVKARMAILRDHLGPDSVLLEFAPGDCRLAYEACQHVRKVIGVDISDQSGESASVPANFELVVYDGYKLEIPDASVDVAFSYQFLEHLHPDDVRPHLAMAHRVLKPGGAYIFDTPHAFSGPHDISRYFSRTPVGFHFKEWTYREMMAELKAAGFSCSYTFRSRKARISGAFNALTLAAETAVGLLPHALKQKLSQRLFLGVTMIAFK
jgi:ubiquinone/menaquinone biosynthesis C-methylase UbiE